jgi:hypothetical protein
MFALLVGNMIALDTPINSFCCVESSLLELFIINSLLLITFLNPNFVPFLNKSVLILWININCEEKS